MDVYTLILVGDERSPVKRLQVPKLTAYRVAALAASLAFVLLLAAWDYWRVRAENAALPALRSETVTQAARLRSFQREIARVEAELARVQELERKVRIIASLPGGTAAGGGEIRQVASEAPPRQRPAGVRIDRGQGGAEPVEASFDLAELAVQGAEGVLELGAMRVRVDQLAGQARMRAGSLGTLVGELEMKNDQLASLPSVWPVRGWLTSRYGPRISPFTGRRQMHAGIDIATPHGTPIVAPARGQVAFAGSRGPLGRSVVLDHGFGVKTTYGHTSEILVNAGDTVERGQAIAKVGNSGRSTGPHLHYSVEVDQKSRDPLDYILD